MSNFNFSGGFGRGMGAGAGNGSGSRRQRNGSCQRWGGAPFNPSVDGLDAVPWRGMGGGRSGRGLRNGSCRLDAGASPTMLSRLQSSIDELISQIKALKSPN